MKKAKYVGLAAIALGGVVLVATTTAYPSDFTIIDNFNRPNGVVGRGWTPSADNNGGSFTIKKNALTPTGAGQCTVGINRVVSVDASDVVTISADITQANGDGAVGGRYSNAFRVYSDGGVSSGYGLAFNQTNSGFTGTVGLYVNAAVITSTPTFNYGAAIHVSFSVYPNGSISGYVTDNKEHISVFSFPVRDISSLNGDKVAIVQECAAPTGTPVIVPTIDNVQIEIR